LCENYADWTEVRLVRGSGLFALDHVALVGGAAALRGASGETFLKA